MQISSDYYEKTTVHIFLSVSACTRYKSTKYPNLGGLPQNRYRKQLVLAKQTEGNTKGKYSISENRAKLLPQINGFANYNDNIDPPVSVTDGSAYGNPYNVTQTLQYNANFGLQLQIPLYNQTLYTTLSIAKTMDEMNRLSYGKAREDLILQISQMYYLGQVTAEQIILIKANITRLEELRDITQAFYDNGMAMEVDVKRVNINLENLKVQHDNAQAMMEQQLNLLKYIIDYPAEERIALVPVNTETITPAALTGLSETLYELQLLQSQKQLAEQQKTIISNGYILLEPDGKLDVLRLYRQSLPLVPFRPFQPLVSLLWSGPPYAFPFSTDWTNATRCVRQPST